MQTDLGPRCIQIRHGFVHAKIISELIANVFFSAGFCYDIGSRQMSN